MNSMMSSPLLDGSGIIFLFLYLFSLIGIGLLGYFSKKENSLGDFYLAGRGMGGFVLFLTLYATQYSGNTMIGFSGRAYREGFTALVTVTFMCAIIGLYFMYAPKLHDLSKKHGFITLGDFISHRFKSFHLTLIISLISIVALGNYILTNLKAIGYIVEGVTGGQVSFVNAIIILSIIMVIYETLGGMRSVAWTDMLQGILLLFGVVIIFIIIFFEYGGINMVSSKLQLVRPDFWTPPNWNEKRLWLSTILIVSIGVSVYPHAIQRIYSAKDSLALRKSLQIMVFMPFVTTLFMVIVGIVGASQIEGLNRIDSEQISILLLLDLAEKITGISWLLVLFLSATIAAIMSTVDSALLAISSMVTQDLYGKAKPNSSQKHLLLFGKLTSWIIMFIAVVMAIKLPQTIWQLFQIKLELLCQIAPAIFLGIHLKSLSSKSILFGIYVGLIISLSIMIGNWSGLSIPIKPFGIHAGLWGLIFNLLFVFGINKYKIVK
ncbi:MAG: sodium:solute symporter family protein [Candidatus Neomarinimicrobiota bacterium]|nr:sodium:solute symporter family protein [Candidatus Neomarinimicrobiota bacterium]